MLAEGQEWGVRCLQHREGGSILCLAIRGFSFHSFLWEFAPHNVQMDSAPPSPHRGSQPGPLRIFTPKPGAMGMISPGEAFYTQVQEKRSSSGMDSSWTGPQRSCSL